MFIKYEDDNFVFVNGKKRSVTELGVPKGFEKYFVGLYFTTAQFNKALSLAKRANDAFMNGIIGKEKDFVSDSNRLLDELEKYVSKVDPVGYLGCEAEDDPDYDDTLWGS